MSNQLFDSIQKLIRKAPQNWLVTACDVLRSTAPTATADFVRKRMPVTNNADLAFLMSEVLQHSEGMLSWEALSWSLQSASDTYHRLQNEQHIELLWSGPSPNDHIPARRIDQALYDLIAKAEHEILLVTFAAAKIERLTKELQKAIQRGVKVSLILEFAESSEGQLSFDALKAFPADLVASAHVYYWPVEKRERNQAGKPGKLHAKLAIIDDVALVTSANLTDDAFSRNLELGVMVRDEHMLKITKKHIGSLVSQGAFQLISS